MSTAASVLAARVAAALLATTVAAQAGVAAVTWASATTPRAFRGIGSPCYGKNRGRLPFIEYDVGPTAFEALSVEGGTLTQEVRIVAHAGGRDLGTVSEQLGAMLAAALASIRSQTTDNLTALQTGADSIGETQPGPWGSKREARIVVNQSYEATDYEVQ